MLTATLSFIIFHRNYSNNLLSNLFLPQLFQLALKNIFFPLKTKLEYRIHYFKIGIVSVRINC